jgi:four helix bundle protein
VKKEPGELEARLLQYAVRIFRLCASLPKTEEGLHIRRQILRSDTSAGANHQEARGAESRSDFIHKMQIVLKELRETQYWLRLIEASESAHVGDSCGIR